MRTRSGADKLTASSSKAMDLLGGDEVESAIKGGI
jgi:hypothetical protein